MPKQFYDKELEKADKGLNPFDSEKYDLDGRVYLKQGSGEQFKRSIEIFKRLGAKYEKCTKRWYYLDFQQKDVSEKLAELRRMEKHWNQDPPGCGPNFA